jgi:hypothetical protein
MDFGGRKKATLLRRRLGVLQESGGLAFSHPLAGRASQSDET